MTIFITTVEDSSPGILEIHGAHATKQNAVEALITKVMPEYFSMDDELIAQAYATFEKGNMFICEEIVLLITERELS